MGLFGFGKVKTNAKAKQEMKSEAGGGTGETEGKSGGFVGFVLLSEPEWDRDQMVRDFMEDWNIDISDSNEDGAREEYRDIIMTEQGDMRLAISFISAPVPEGEAEHYAAANYMWSEAVETVRGHKAQLLVAVLGGRTDLLEQGRLFVKAAAVCLKQRYASAIYTDGAVFEPGFYRECALMMKEGSLPILNLVWFGLYRSETQAGIYTYGMKKLGKDEMEIYVDIHRANLNEIRNFTADIVNYVLEYDVTLRDGETIGFSAEQKLPITRSRGIALDGNTLKIGYNSR